jgi:hypothetical protein
LIITPDLVSEEDIAKLIIPDDLPNDEPSFKAYIEAKVYDKEGHLIQYRRQPMRSLTQYFLALMSIPLVGTYQGPSTNQASGILVNVLGLPSQQYSYLFESYNAANILWDWSIQLGSGTQAFSVSLTGLAAPIANGTGTGQLYYGALNVLYTSTSIIATITVTNHSTSAISVAEIGLLGNVYIQYQNSSNQYAYNTYSFLLSYDTFSTPMSIPSNGLVTFQITLTFTG